MKLSKEQTAAVMHIQGPALCIAGPGSGKTAVIINRVKNLIAKGVAPPHILVVTFAKAAARNMEKRFYDMTGISDVRFSTIHSLCYHIINTGKHTKAALVPDKVKRALLLQMISKYGSYRAAADKHYRDVSMEISRFKSVCEESGATGTRSELTFLREYETHFADKELFADIYPAYASFLKQNAYYDFDDMTYLARSCIKNDPDILKSRLGFEHILADEFQDTSISQLYLLNEISVKKNIFAVGDDDQSIYSFRGASPEIFRVFSSLYPEYECFILKDNYRCSADITEAANIVIRENKSRFPKEIISRYNSRYAGSCVHVKTFNTPYDEMKGIYDQLTENRQKPNESFAVLTRTNYEAELVCSFFKKKGIAFNSSLKNADPFDHASVNMILSYIRLSLKRGTLKDFVNAFKTSDVPLSAQVLSVCCDGDQDTAFLKLQRYAEGNGILKRSVCDLQQKTELLQDMQPSVQVMFIRNVCGIDRYFKDKFLLSGDDYEICEERMNSFAEFAKDFSTPESLVNYTDEVVRVDLAKGKISGNSEKSNVYVMTLHASKGLEFDRVWILNANEGLIPYRKAVEKGMYEEERRLFYVGMTRAKDRLIISCHKSSGNKKTAASSFLKHLTSFC